MKRFMLAFCLMIGLVVVAYAGTAPIEKKELEAQTGFVQTAPVISQRVNQITPEYAAEKHARGNGGASLDAVVTSLCNTLVCVQLNDAGDFNIGTLDGRSLLYYYPGEPATSNIIISVDGLRYKLDLGGSACDGGATFDSWTNDGESIIANYTVLGYIGVQVIHTPVQFNVTTAAILTRTVVTNNDMNDVDHAIGVLYEYDTTVDGDDAAELYLGATHLLDETCYDAPYAANYWDAIPSAGTLVGRGTFTGGDAVTPDHMAFGQWGPFVNACWSHVCSGLPYGDSAVLYQWDETPVASGGSRSVATYYGVGDVIVAEGDLQVSVSLPPLECINYSVQPDPFQVLVNITNTGGSTCTDILVYLSNGNDAAGTGTVISTTPQIIPSLNPNDNAAVSFTVDLNANPQGGCIYFTAEVHSANCPINALTFCVEIPVCEPFVCDCCQGRDSHGNYEGGPLPDLTTNDFIISVPFEYNITDLNVCLDLVHTFDGDLELVLYSPAGTPVTLSWHNGSYMDNYTCTTFDDEAGTAIGAGTPPYMGSFIPDVPLSTFDGENAIGNWTLRIIDWAGLDEGYLHWVCLNFEYDEILPVELIGFDAIAGDRSVSLNWATASENNSDHFDVQRDGTTVGRVTASNSATGSTYNWSESNLTNGREYAYSLVAVDVSGSSETIGTVNATPTANNATVTEYALHQNYPNPFNPETNIMFDLAEAGNISLTVYNPLGQTIATLVNGTMQAGRHTVSFDAANLPSGLYFYRLDAADFSAIRKMVLMK